MENNKKSKPEDQNGNTGSEALGGVGTSANMMPSAKKVKEQSSADPAVEKDVDALLHKKKKETKD